MGNSLPITGGRGNTFVFMLKWNLVNPVTNGSKNLAVLTKKETD